MRIHQSAAIVAMLLALQACSDATTDAGIARPVAPSASAKQSILGVQEYIYWTDAASKKIQRSNLDGSNIFDLVTGLSEPQGIAVDADGGKMYWAELFGGTGAIRRANLDGFGVQTLVGSVGPVGIALNVAAGKMYWTDAFVSSTIQRANLVGTNIEGVVLSPGDREGIALDPVGGKIYWTDRSGLAGKIQRANLDGTGIQNLITTGLGDPRGIALDVDAGKMYWADALTHKIQRANLDGSALENLVVTGLVNPGGVALDRVDAKIYWADFGAGKIRRADLNGSGVEDVVNGLAVPAGIALEIHRPLSVEIDIKPGSSGTLNPRSQGILSVAILTTGSFDAAFVDVPTVRFGAHGTEAVPQRWAREDIDGDGDLDLVLQFRTEDTGIQCGDTSASLTGKTHGRLAIRGSDAVRTVGCK